MRDAAGYTVPVAAFGARVSHVVRLATKHTLLKRRPLAEPGLSSRGGLSFDNKRRLQGSRRNHCPLQCLQTNSSNESDHVGCRCQFFFVATNPLRRDWKVCPISGGVTPKGRATVARKHGKNVTAQHRVICCVFPSIKLALFATFSLPLPDRQAAYPREEMNNHHHWVRVERKNNGQQTSRVRLLLTKIYQQPTVVQGFFAAVVPVSSRNGVFIHFVS